MPGVPPKEITLDDVVAYAADLRAQRARFSNPAPANPAYRPFDKVWAPTDEEARAMVRRIGAEKAMRQIKYRAETSLDRIEIEDHLEKSRQARERSRRERERRDAEELSTGMTPGARISRALGELRVVAEGRAQNFGEIVKGGGDGRQAPINHGYDEYRKGCAIALHAARRIEGLLERARRSPLPPPKIANRDEQLRAMRGYSPEQVAIMAASQGLPRQIRERREKMGLDPETGDPQLKVA
jgi:hypothetical protein